MLNTLVHTIEAISNTTGIHVLMVMWVVFGLGMIAMLGAFKSIVAMFD